MRGLLMAMMGQRSKVSPIFSLSKELICFQVEKFKSSFSKEDSLHAKFCSKTGKPVVGDSEWGRCSQPLWEVT